MRRPPRIDRTRRRPRSESRPGDPRGPRALGLRRRGDARTKLRCHRRGGSARRGDDAGRLGRSRHARRGRRGSGSEGQPPTRSLRTRSARRRRPASRPSVTRSASKSSQPVTHSSMRRSGPRSTRSASARWAPRSGPTWTRSSTRPAPRLAAAVSASVAAAAAPLEADARRDAATLKNVAIGLAVAAVSLILALGFAIFELRRHRAELRSLLSALPTDAAVVPPP